MYNRVRNTYTRVVACVWQCSATQDLLPRLRTQRPHKNATKPEASQGPGTR